MTFFFIHSNYIMIPFVHIYSKLFLGFYWWNVIFFFFFAQGDLVLKCFSVFEVLLWKWLFSVSKPPLERFNKSQWLISISLNYWLIPIRFHKPFRRKCDHSSEKQTKIRTKTWRQQDISKSCSFFGLTHHYNPCFCMFF